MFTRSLNQTAVAPQSPSAGLLREIYEDTRARREGGRERKGLWEAKRLQPQVRLIPFRHPFPKTSLLRGQRTEEEKCEREGSIL